MEGAIRRDQRDKALVWWGAMLPWTEKPPSFEKFTGIRPDRSAEIARCSEQWQKLTEALKRGSRCRNP
jgi:hypothetical protein